MPIMTLAPADKEIAAATFKQHMHRLWTNGRPDRFGWERKELDPLHMLVKLPATRPSGEIDPYYFLIGAEYYDAAPPTVRLVVPDSLEPPPAKSRWFPKIDCPSWFGLHAEYAWPTGPKRQLVCFSMNAEFYMTNHSPKESEQWKQNRHTVAMTLNRLAEILSPKYYRGPSA